MGLLLRWVKVRVSVIGLGFRIRVIGFVLEYMVRVMVIYNISDSSRSIGMSQAHCKQHNFVEILPGQFRPSTKIYVSWCHWVFRLV